MTLKHGKLEACVDTGTQKNAASANTSIAVTTLMSAPYHIDTTVVTGVPAVTEGR